MTHSTDYGIGATHCEYAVKNYVLLTFTVIRNFSKIANYMNEEI